MLRIAVIDIRSFQEVKYMCYTGLFKRIVPFVLTFAAGLFIASFFVSIALPEGNWRSRRGKKFQEVQRLKADLELERDKNLRLQMEVDELRRNAKDWPLGETPMVPPVDFELHNHHPAPPKRPKQPRFE